MAKMLEKSFDVVKQGVDSLKNIKNDKREYKEYLERIKALPDDYRFVFEKITAYMWNLCGGGNGNDMMALQADLLELFESSVADGKHVFEVIGEDVATFCDELLRNTKTYTENWREKLNRDIHKQLMKKEKE